MNFLMALLLVSCSLQDQSLKWASFRPPLYPRNAQIAHIQGPVTIKFELSTDSDLKVLNVEGHPLLRAAALESLTGSKLRCENCGDQTKLFSVVYEFRVAERNCDDPLINAVHEPTLESANHVSVIAEPICTSDPTIRISRLRVRSIRCLYLWRCGFSKPISE